MGNKSSKKNNNKSNKSSKPVPNESICSDFNSFLGVYNSLQLPNPAPLVGDYKYENNDSDDDYEEDEEDEEEENDPEFPKQKLKRIRVLSTYFHDHLNQFIIISSMGLFKRERWSYTDLKIEMLEVMIYNFGYKQKKKKKLNNLTKSMKLHKIIYIQCDGLERRRKYMNKKHVDCRAYFNFDFHPKYLYLFIMKSERIEIDRKDKTTTHSILLYDLNNSINSKKVFQLQLINQPNIIFRPLFSENTKYAQYDKEEVDYINEQDDKQMVEGIDRLNFINYKETEYLLINGGRGSPTWIIFKYDVMNTNTKQTEYIHFWSEFKTSYYSPTEGPFSNQAIIDYFRSTQWGHSTYYAVAKRNTDNLIHIILVFDSHAKKNRNLRQREIIYVEFNLDNFQFEWNPINNYQADLVYDEDDVLCKQITGVEFLPSNKNFILPYQQLDKSDGNGYPQYIRIHKYKDTKTDQYSAEVRSEFAEKCYRGSRINKYFESNRYGDIGVMGSSLPNGENSRLYQNEIKILGENTLLMSGATKIIYHTLSTYLNNVGDIIKIIMDMIGMVNGLKIIKLPIQENAAVDRNRNRIGSMASIAWCKNYDTMFVLEYRKHHEIIHIFATP